MQLARAEVLDGCSLLLYLGLPLLTVGGFNSSPSKNIMTLQEHMGLLNLIKPNRSRFRACMPATRVGMHFSTGTLHSVYACADIETVALPIVVVYLKATIFVHRVFKDNYGAQAVTWICHILKHTSVLYFAHTFYKSHIRFNKICARNRKKVAV